MKDKEICHVCKREKKPYLKIMDSNALSMITHFQAREDGDICERCDNYFAMTGEFKDATEEEYKKAQEGCRFARLMLEWWEKDKKIDSDLDDGCNDRSWGGIYGISKWYRERGLQEEQTSEEKLK